VVLDPGSEGLIDYLVVGGGGGGSTGGGGAGGVLTHGSTTVPLASLGSGSSLVLVVGEGGAGRLAHSSSNSEPGTARTERGDNGQSSQLGNLTAIGGGGGGAYGDGGVLLRTGGGFQERCHSLAAVQAACINGSCPGSSSSSGG